MSYQDLYEQNQNSISLQCQVLESKGLKEDEIKAKYEELIREHNDRFRMFFKIKVADAMYDQEKVMKNKRDTIITIMDTNINMYETMKEGDRVVFYKLYMDTYNKNGRNKSKYLDEKQLTLSYKSKTSRYSSLKDYNLYTASDNEIGKSRIDSSVTLDNMLLLMSHTYQKTKSMTLEERKTTIKHEMKLHEIWIVGLVLKIWSKFTEHTPDLEWVKTVYLLLPKHHLVILNVSTYSQNYFRYEIQTFTLNVRSQLKTLW